MNSNTFRLQVQPSYAQRQHWTALSQQEGLFFEALELSMGRKAEPDCLQWYRGCGRTTAVHGAFIDVNPASGDNDFRRLSQEKCHESCRIAALLGAEYVVFHSSAFPFLRGGYLESWAAQCADFYAQLAREYRLHLCIENSQDVDPAPLRELMRRLRGEDVSVCLDIGHANYSSAPLQAWFDALGDHIAYLHLSDNMGSFDDHLPLGCGTVDWAAADRLWRSLNRQTPITLEVGGPDGVAQSLAWLRSRSYFTTEANNHE